MTETMQTSELARIGDDIAQLDSKGLPVLPDQILLARGMCDEVMRQAEAMKKQLNVFLVAWLRANGGRYEAGEFVWWLGGRKKVKCKNPKATLEALGEATGGDWAAVCDCLKSDAIKYGAARDVLSPEKYAELFETTYADVIEGDPETELQTLNKAFLK